MNHRLDHRLDERRGAVLVVVLVCLVLLTVIGGALLRLVVLERKQLDAQYRTAQARWLVEAGVGRAAARLAADRDYAGETWTLGADEIAGGQPAAITIEIAAEPDRPGSRRLSVQADYPRYGAMRARLSKQIEFEWPAAGETE